jgi:amidase
MDATELAYAGIARQAELVRSGEVSPSELVEVCLERIERIEPRLNSFRVVYDERARAEAKQAEGRAGAGDERPLLGVPVAIKDNIDMAGEVTTDGSAAYGPPAQADAEQVRRLREAGAIVIGRTHLPELAIFPQTESDAWGITRNPWDTGRTPGGSSGGSGAAVAAGLAGAGLATDGGGSIRIPAACCGLVGLKTQRGRVSLAPFEEHWQGLSVAGSVTRHVIDTALWLDVVAGGPGASAPAPERSFAESARSAPGKLRVALSTKPWDRLAKVHDAVRRGVEEVGGALLALGHDVSERDPDYGDLRALFIPRWSYGIHEDVQARPNPERLEPRTRRLARVGALIGAERVREARAKEEARAARINAIFDDHDVLLSPTITQPPPRAGAYMGKGMISSINRAAPFTPFTVPWNITGQPAISIPAPSQHEGVPLAAQLVGKPNDEATLISLAAQLEAEIGWPQRRPPVD